MAPQGPQKPLCCSYYWTTLQTMKKNSSESSREIFVLWYFSDTNSWKKKPIKSAEERHRKFILGKKVSWNALFTKSNMYVSSMINQKGAISCSMWQILMFFFNDTLEKWIWENKVISAAQNSTQITSTQVDCVCFCYLSDRPCHDFRASKSVDQRLQTA